MTDKDHDRLSAPESNQAIRRILANDDEHLSAPESRRTLARMLAEGRVVTCAGLASVLCGRGYQHGCTWRCPAFMEAAYAISDLEQSGEAVRVFIGRDVFDVSVETAEGLPAAAAEGITEAREQWESEPRALPPGWQVSGRVSASEREEIRKLTAAGWPVAAITRKLRRSETTVRKYRKSP